MPVNTELELGKELCLAPCPKFVTAVAKFFNPKFSVRTKTMTSVNSYGRNEDSQRRADRENP